MLNLRLPDLPIRAALPGLVATLAVDTRAVLEAPPGAGKTTLVPLALLAAPWRAGSKILVLEPRRLAARAAATRMAALLGEAVGQTVGYRVRLENRVSAATRIEVVTEGILTRLLQDDPALEGIAAVLFDEFHERSLQADLGLALTLDAQTLFRPDLRVLLMSATLETDRIAAWLGAGDGSARPAPVVRSEGKMYPVKTSYATPADAARAGNRPNERLASLAPAAVHRALREHSTGDVLVFLPGLADQRRVADKLSLGPDTDLHVLHGELPLDEQDAALRPAPVGRRKVVLATSIAETSLTIEGVRIVVDGGYARVPRFEPRTGLTTLATEPVSQAAADQRRGRAGRLGPGICYRLWPEADQPHLAAHAAPEIRGGDLSALALETAVWGTPAESLRWLDPPPVAALALARDLLERLAALSYDVRGAKPEATALASGEPVGYLTKPTAHGRALACLGLTPRLGHLVLRGQAAGHGATAATLAALLAERDVLASAGGATGAGGRAEAINPDLRLRLETLATGRAPLPGLVPDRGVLARTRDAATALRRRAGIADGYLAPDAAGLLTALAYPDRLAQRETPERVRLLTGQRVLLPDHFFSASDQFFAIAALESGGTGLARAALAAPVSLAEIEAEFSAQIETADEVRFDDATGRVTARRRRRL
ncbi:MAG: ATP-dependent helicase HrpB, partial [Hymenobacteraceae bacterium]|nr:ATP-dependent helicase HrpB [Hymenobacteraceae bacterium]